MKMLQGMVFGFLVSSMAYGVESVDCDQLSLGDRLKAQRSAHVIAYSATSLLDTKSTREARERQVLKRFNDCEQIRLDRLHAKEFGVTKSVSLLAKNQEQVNTIRAQEAALREALNLMVCHKQTAGKEYNIDRAKSREDIKRNKSIDLAKKETHVHTIRQNERDVICLKEQIVAAKHDARKQYRDFIKLAESKLENQKLARKEVSAKISEDKKSGHKNFWQLINVSE